MHAPGQGHGLVRTVITATPESVRISRVFKIFSKIGFFAIFLFLSNLRYSLSNNWFDDWALLAREEMDCFR